MFRMIRPPAAKINAVEVIDDPRVMFRQLKIWTESNSVAVSTIPPHLADFPWFFPDGRPNRAPYTKPGEKSMNIDDLVFVLRQWFLGRAPVIQKFEHHYYFKNIAPQQILRVSNGLEDGEVEHPIARLGRKTEWRGEYAWRVYIANEETDRWGEGRGSGVPTSARMWLYLENLPEQLHRGISWQDENQARAFESYSREGSKGWRHVTHWNDTDEKRGWEAVIGVEHGDFPEAYYSDSRAYFAGCDTYVE